MIKTAMLTSMRRASRIPARITRCSSPYQRANHSYAYSSSDLGEEIFFKKRLCRRLQQIIMVIIVIQIFKFFWAALSTD